MKRRAQTGLTLIEFLIAIVLLSLCLVILYAALHVVTRGWDALEGPGQEARRIFAVEQLTRRLLEQTTAAFDGVGDRRAIIFAGNRTALEFVSPAPARHDVPGLYRVLLTLDATHGPARLSVRYELLRDVASAARPPAVEKPLLAPIEDVAFEYFGAERLGEVPHWRSTWHSNAALPVLVRIGLTRHAHRYSWTVSVRAQGAEVSAG